MRLPLLQKRRQAFSSVRRVAQLSEQARFQGQGVMKIQLDTLADRPKGRAHRHLAFRGNRARQPLSLTEEILRGNDLRYETNRLCFLRRDRLTGQDQLHGFRLTDDPGKSLRAAESRHDPQIDFRLAQSATFRGKPDMATHGQFQSSAQANPVDGSNHRFSNLFDPIQDGLALQSHGLPFL